MDKFRFNLWSDGYEKSVYLSEEKNEYPFAGYREVLGTIYNLIRNGKGNRILDIGIGTGILSKRLYDEGYDITGIDFSHNMLDISRRKMPSGRFITHDFSKGLPIELNNEEFNFIVLTYAIHHLTNPDKVELIKKLKDILAEDGIILIGDVAFETIKDMEGCREITGDGWDVDEYYMVKEVMNKVVDNISFKKISYCSGVFTIE